MAATMNHMFQNIFTFDVSPTSQYAMSMLAQDFTFSSHASLDALAHM